MSQRLPVDHEVIILGDAPEAGWVAQNLLPLGYKVHWVASAGDTEARDSSSPDSQATSWASSPLLARYSTCNLVALDGHVGHFTAQLQQAGEDLRLNAAAVVVATGNERYYPAQRYGLEPNPRVLTVAQVASQLEAAHDARSILPHRHERILIMLDLGGETAKESATEALRLALRLRQVWRGEVYVFYQNLKVDSPGYERLTRTMRERGVVFCRYAAPKLTVSEQGVAVAYVEGTLRGELLVLPEAVRPRADAPELAERLRVRLGADGYFQDINIRHYRPGVSVRKGVFFAGRCHLDVADDEARADAAQAAANVDALLGQGYLEPEATIAHVDETKCIRCLTCVRTCPHAAVEIADYDGQDGTAVTAARVLDLACYGCGACVANCPVRAIELVGQAWPAWMLTGDTVRG